MAVETLPIPRGEFNIEDPWGVPPECEPVSLRLAKDGLPPRLATSVAVFYDDEALTAIFDARDDAVVATHLEHDAQLWEEDVVEVFLAPRALTEYFEVEVNPLGTTFDARIESPDGDRATMRVHLAWTAEGLLTAIRRAGGRAETLIRIPFASLGGAPKRGDEWRGNFFRVDRSAAGDEYSAWQPSMRNPPDFHVPGAFGRLVFG
jgi:alpha-galactosidase